MTVGIGVLFGFAISIIIASFHFRRKYPVLNIELNTYVRSVLNGNLFNISLILSLFSDVFLIGELFITVCTSRDVKYLVGRVSSNGDCRIFQSVDRAGNQ